MLGLRYSLLQGCWHYDSMALTRAKLTVSSGYQRQWSHSHYLPACHCLKWVSASVKSQSLSTSVSLSQVGISVSEVTVTIYQRVTVSRGYQRQWSHSHYLPACHCLGVSCRWGSLTPTLTLAHEHYLIPTTVFNTEERRWSECRPEHNLTSWPFL